jgi:hypothetical protein
MIKNKIIFIVIFFAFTNNYVFSQSNKANDQVNFARIISYNVLIKDTSKLIDKINYYDDSLTNINTFIEDGATQFIDPLSYRQFINVIKKYLNDKNAFSAYNSKPIKMEELKQKIYPCDSMPYELVDAETGNSIIAIKYSCDSTSIFAETRMINFIESWSIDQKTYEFKKEVLSYGFIYWDENKKTWQKKLVIYKNKQAFEFIQSVVK